MNMQSPSDADLERRLRERFRDRYGEPPAPDTLWVRLASRLEPREEARVADEGDVGYEVSPFLREIALEDIVATDTDTERRLHTVRSTRSTRSTRPNAYRSRGRARLIAILAPAAAVLVLAALGGALLAMQGRDRQSTRLTAIQTVTAIQTGQLTWQPATYPAIDPNVTDHAYMLAQSDGATAFECIVPRDGSSRPRMWVTHDRAQHWTRLVDVPTARNPNFCDLGVDMLDPQLVTVSTLRAGASGATPPPDQWEQFASFDGGRSWRALGNQQSYFPIGPQFHATIGGKTYAQRAELAPGTAQFATHLYVSDDQLHTWTRIDGPIWSSVAARAPSPGQSNFLFRVQPSTGEILVEILGSQLWDSRDGGAHGTQVVVPISNNSSPYLRFYYAWPIAGQALRICALGQALGYMHGSDPALPFTCTTDGGKTWTDRTGLIFGPCEGGGCAPSTANHLGLVTPFSMLGDGTLFAYDSSGHIWRLPPDATSEREWVQLGACPGAPTSTVDQCGLAGVPTPSGDLVIWANVDSAAYTTTVR